MEFVCENCANKYKSKKALTRHVQRVHENIIYECEKCGFRFTRLSNLVNHTTSESGALRCRINVINKNSKKSSKLTTSTSSTAAAAGAVAVTTPTSTSSTAAAGAVAVTTPTSTSSAAAAGAVTTPPSTSSAGAGTTTRSETTSSTVNNEFRFCDTCNNNVKLCYWPYHVRTNAHKRNSGIASANPNVHTINSVFKERIQTLLLENNDEGELRAEVFLQSLKSSLISVIAELLEKHTAIKWNMELFGEYVKIVDTEISAIDIKSHQTTMMPSMFSTNLSNAYDEMTNIILAKMSEFQERDSGWTLVKLLHLEVNVNQYRPITGSSYIPLPIEVLRRKACINVHNSDEYCFKWAIISSLFDVIASPHRCSSYNIIDITRDIIEVNGLLLDFRGLEFPLAITQIAEFERMNPLFSVNTFGYDRDIAKVVGPYYITKEEKVRHINLLLLQEEDRSHFVWIKNISR